GELCHVKGTTFANAGPEPGSVRPEGSRVEASQRCRFGPSTRTPAGPCLGPVGVPADKSQVPTAAERVSMRRVSPVTRLSISLFLPLLALLPAQTGRAQDTGTRTATETGTISGSVKDEATGAADGCAEVA